MRSRACRLHDTYGGKLSSDRPDWPDWTRVSDWTIRPDLFYRLDRQHGINGTDW
jgi:hypothetical protein